VALDRPQRFSMVRCRWSGNAPSPARGCQGAATRHLVDGCMETDIRCASFSGKTLTKGFSGELGGSR